MTSWSVVWRPAAPPHVGVSSCLLGEPVRYNGGHKKESFLSEALSRHVEWVPTCPEVEIGLGTPRPTLRVEREGHRSRLISQHGVEHTGTMESFTRGRITELARRRLCGYVLKSKSPSCGLGSVPAYAGGRLVDRHGNGLYASSLADAQPLLAIEEETGLRETAAREHFVERVFAHARLRDMFERAWQVSDLVDFHARHKLQLMAHSPELAREAGRIVTAAGRQVDDVSSSYRELFLRTLAVRPTTGLHVNALQHALGQLDTSVDAHDRQDISTAITRYGEGDVALRVPVDLLASHAESGTAEPLRTQTFLAPFPPDLGLREHTRT